MSTCVSAGANLATARGQLTIDFLPPKDLTGHRVYPLEEEDLKAMYMNNRAVESMLEGRIDDAYWWARGALTYDPASVASYNTLGVIYHRHGNTQMAERAFRLALERKPDNLVMRNLVPVQAKLGGSQESQVLARRLAAIQPEPAFHYFTLGPGSQDLTASIVSFGCCTCHRSCKINPRQPGGDGHSDQCLVFISSAISSPPPWFSPNSASSLPSETSPAPRAAGGGWPKAPPTPGSAAGPVDLIAPSDGGAL